MKNTIFAMATARGKSGVAIVRVSGPSAQAAGLALGSSLPAERVAGIRTLRDLDGQILDEALVLWFSAGHSFTGEDTVEFQIHGSTATADAVQRSLGMLDDLRPAEPGEFTRRALENDRLDLAQVEGLADLIDAETEWQRRQALRVFSGALGIKVSGWRQKLIRAAALMEATLDFAEEDVPVDVFPEVAQLVDDVSADLVQQAAGASAAERIRDGFEVAIVGAPNAGKSTLLNALAGRQAAITSEIAGTTRDVIELRMDLQGLPVTFLDTAGLRKTQDVVEAIGVENAIKRAEAADIRVFLVEPNTTYSGDLWRDSDILLVGKADLYTGADSSVSGLTGHGIPEMLKQIAGTLEKRAANAQSAIRARHLRAMEVAIKALKIVRDNINTDSSGTEMVAEDLRVAIQALDSLVGRVDVESILDEIFSSFCIGK